MLKDKVIVILKFLNAKRIRFMNDYNQVKFNYNWRKRNAHNNTWAENIFGFDSVTVGNATYGPLHVKRYNKNDGKLIIGSYVSIASGVRFLLGGNHDYLNFSTFSFKEYFMNKGRENEAFSKGDIIVQDHAWLCDNVTVLSGVTIGRGSVVAAGCVVSKDVEPYSIVAGNPMRIIKKRFDDETIKKLMQLDVNHLDKDKIENNIDLLYTHIDDNVIKQLKEILS